MALLAVRLSAQEFEPGYDALQHALNLTDSQISQLQSAQLSLFAPRHPTSIPMSAFFISAGRMRSGFGPTLTLSSSITSTGIRLLNSDQLVNLTSIARILERHNAATEAIVDGLITPDDWPGNAACLYPIGTYASEFHLSIPQVGQLQDLGQAAQKRVSPSGSPIQRPPHNLALAVLDDFQRTEILEFV